MKRRMKQWLALLLCLCLALPVCAAAEDVKFSGGSGTTEAPYLLATTEDIHALSQGVNSGDIHLRTAHYRVIADIDLEGEEFTPIGTDLETAFSGIFDGAGHYIRGIYSNDEEIADIRSYNYYHGKELPPHYAGLFGVIDGGTLKNLTVEGHVFGGIVGGLVGWSRNGHIYNCVSACTATPWQLNGVVYSGMVGYLEGGKLENSCNIAPISPVIVGGQSENAVITNCYLLGDPWYSSCKGYYVDGNGEIADRVEFTSNWIEDEARDASWSAQVNSWVEYLNAWVDTQPSTEYAKWYAVPGGFPTFGEHFITLSVETGAYLPLGTTEGFTKTEINRTGGLVSHGYDSNRLNSSVVPVWDGNSATLFCTAYDGFRVLDILLDGKSIGADDAVTLDNVTDDHTLTLRCVREGTLENFGPDYPYNGYTDVKESAWYGTEGEGVVEMVTRLGLFQGVGEGKFAPDENLTLAEVIKLAAVIRNTYQGNYRIFDQSEGEHWYDTYASYAIEQRIVEEGEFEELTRPATRTEMAHIFYHTLPYMEYPWQSNLRPSDLAEEEPYETEIIRLYEAGILKGSDSAGTFHGESTITRAEAAAIAVRVALPEYRNKD